MFILYSFKKLEFFEQVGKIHYFRAGSIKRAGRNFEQNSIIEQVLIRASRLENDQNFLVRACSLNRDTRVRYLVGSKVGSAEKRLFISNSIRRLSAL